MSGPMTAEVQRELCTSTTGFVVGSWDPRVGTGNILNSMLTGVLLAIALDRPFVLTTESLKGRAAFNATLKEAASGYGGMPWVMQPRSVAEDSRLRWSDSPSASSRSLLQWCGDSSKNMSSRDVVHVDLRPGKEGYGNSGVWDLRTMIKRGGLCVGKLLQARFVTFYASNVANFVLFAANRNLPEQVQERVDALTARGVNAYGLAQRALWPEGLTHFGTSYRPTAAVHMRCYLGLCSEGMVVATARCLASKLLKAGLGCSIYVASDNNYAPQLLAQALHTVAPNLTCVVTSAAAMYERLSESQLAQVKSFGVAAAHSHPIATPHSMGTAGHRPSWTDPVDLEILAASELLVGSVMSTMSWIAGTRVGSQYYYMDGYGQCPSAAPSYPTPTWPGPRSALPTHGSSVSDEESKHGLEVGKIVVPRTALCSAGVLISSMCGAMQPCNVL